jgi:hypothetical protein
MHVHAAQHYECCQQLQNTTVSRCKGHFESISTSPDVFQEHTSSWADEVDREIPLHECTSTNEIIRTARNQLSSVSSHGEHAHHKRHGPKFYRNENQGVSTADAKTRREIFEGKICCIKQQLEVVRADLNQSQHNAYILSLMVSNLCSELASMQQHLFFREWCQKSSGQLDTLGLICDSVGGPHRHISQSSLPFPLSLSAVNGDVSVEPVAYGAEQNGMEQAIFCPQELYTICPPNPFVVAHYGY